MAMLPDFRKGTLGSAIIRGFNIPFKDLPLYLSEDDSIIKSIVIMRLKYGIDDCEIDTSEDYNVVVTTKSLIGTFNISISIDMG